MQTLVKQIRFEYDCCKEILTHPKVPKVLIIYSWIALSFIVLCNLSTISLLAVMVEALIHYDFDIVSVEKSVLLNSNIVFIVIRLLVPSFLLAIPLTILTVCVEFKLESVTISDLPILASIPDYLVILGTLVLYSVLISMSIKICLHFFSFIS